MSICDDVSAFVDGELPPEQAEAFRRHLGEGCEACERALLVDLWITVCADSYLKPRRSWWRRPWAWVRGR